MILIILGCILAYLIGSIPSGFVLNKYLRGIDVREVGSGNIGATNSFRAGGKAIGIASLLMDIAKGIIALILLPRILSSPDMLSTKIIQALYGFWVIIGHNYTIFLKFKGGKGIATSAGVVLILSPYVLLWGAVSWGVVFCFSRYVSLASIVSSIIIPTIAFFYDLNPSIKILYVVLAMLSLYRHKANIKRLIKGEELKISSKKT